MGNTALAVVRGNTPFKTVVVYFGSGGRAPMVTKGFTPGLTVDVRSLPKGPANNWRQVSTLLTRSKRIAMSFVDKIEQAYNPADSSDACLLVFEGYLNIRKAGRYTYMIVTDDAGYFFVDDKLVLSRDGRHFARDAARGECRADVSLTAGVHKIRFVLVDFGGELMAVLGQWVSRTKKFTLPPDAYVRSGKTRLLGVESRYRDAPMPVFRCQALSYMSYNGAQYTEMLFEAVNGKESLWRFDDGARAKGPSCHRIFPGLRTRGVACTQGRVTAKGVAAISEVPPKRLLMSNATQFKRYSKMILDQDLKHIDPTTLRGYVTFLEYHPLNADLIPVCEAIVADKRAAKRIRLAALLDLGRVASRSDPEMTKKAYSRLLKEQTPEAWPASAREAAEVALFALRDFDLADTIIKQLARRAGPSDKVVVALRLDLALQRGEVDGAKKMLDTLLSGKDLGRRQRYSAVQGNALRERFYELLSGDFPLLAWDVLHQWDLAAPNDRTNGSFALARAKLWQRLGWLDGALGELDGAILLDPLLPNLPDIELERAKTLALAGNTKEANELFVKIIKEYPNHPAASEAKRRIR